MGLRAVRFGPSILQGASPRAHLEVYWGVICNCDYWSQFLQRSLWMVFCSALNSCLTQFRTFAQVHPCSGGGAKWRRKSTRSLDG